MPDKHAYGVRTINRVCAVCKQKFPKEHLVAKRVEFWAFTKPAKRLRSRTVAWLCTDCMTKDPAYQQEAWIDSPGLIGPNP